MLIETIIFQERRTSTWELTEYAHSQEVTEQLGAENQIEWARRMNNIRICVREIVESEIIYL